MTESPPSRITLTVAGSESTAPRVERTPSIDVLRGAVMVLMALDHTRDFFGEGSVRPTDLAHAPAALFLTRWITHFCAPVFILLAGTAAFLSRSRGRTGADLSRFLVSRGLWLVFVELTIVHMGWHLEPTYRFTMLQVIWAIGWSMVVLAALVRLPMAAVVGVGAAMIVLHNLLDGIHPTGVIEFPWAVLHRPGAFTVARGHRLYVAYPLIPWVGVMACGYALGAWYTEPRERRVRKLGVLGVALIALFVATRLLRLYGDPNAWSPPPGRGTLYAVLAVLNCQKYPPSLDYLLMTLGPALCVLAWLDARSQSAAARALATIGRVPFFYYVTHLYVIHVAAIAVVVARQRLHPTRAQLENGPEFSLLGVYAVWALAVTALYPACRWFAGVKARRRTWWLSYL